LEGDIIKRLIAVLILFVLVSGCLTPPVTNTGGGGKGPTDDSDTTIDSGGTGEGTNTEQKEIGDIQTFSESQGEICTQDGKPVVRLFSTTWCPHCVWIKETFDSIAKEYVDEGKIVAYHWELDTGDNTLTSEIETSVPDSEKAVYQQFNPKGSIPTFVFGCKYSRVGNGYESAKDLEAEAKEFRGVIEKLLEG